MGELRVQNPELLIPDKKAALSPQESANSSIEITLNKNKEIPQPDKAIEKQIRTMVTLLYPNVNWNSLSDIEKQGYIVQFYDGTLTQKFKEILPKIEEFKASIKILSPEEASDKVIQTVLERKDPNFKNYSQEEQETHKKLECLQLLKEFNPESDIENMSEEEKARLLDNAKFKLQTACYAYQTGKIEKLEDFKKYKPTQIHDLEYEFATKTQKTSENFTTDTMNSVIAKGDLDRAIAEKNNISLEEFRESEDKYTLMFKYLKEKPEAELNDYEKKQLNTLKKLTYIYGDDLKGMKLASDGSITDSYLHKLSGGQKKDWESPAQFQILCDTIKADIQKCKNPEERQAKMAEILAGVSDAEEAMLISEAFAKLEKTNIIDVNDLLIAAEEIHQTTHALVACSHHMSADGQKCTAEHVAKHCKGEHAEFTAKQAAGVATNMIGKYEEDVQGETLTTLIKTGLKEVIEATPEAIKNLTNQNAKEEVFEYTMTSDVVSDEQKAIIARDTIDTTDNADLKKFFEDLANKYNVDYNTVPPKTERTNAPANNKPADNKTADNNTNSNTKVTGTDYTQQEVANILAKTSEPQNILSMAGKALQETVDIILGKTPENNLQAKIPTITSLNTAITQLKTGTKLNDVFRQSNNETKKELVEVICKYGKTAIAQLIDTFGGQTIYKLAKSDNARVLIKKEIERIALSDATQRAELAEIKKAEAKDGMKAKA